MKRFFLFVVLLLWGPIAGAASDRSALFANLENLCRTWGWIKYTTPDTTIDMDRELLSILPTVLAAPDTAQGRAVIEAWSRRFPARSVVTGIPVNPRYFELKLESDAAVFKEQSYPDRHYSEQPYRLLTLFRLWNAVYYFSPYRDLADRSWDLVLKEFLPVFFDYKDDLSYIININKFMACLDEEHGWVKLHDDLAIQPNFADNTLLPLRLNYINGQVVVMDVFDRKLDFRPGDVICRVNNREVHTILDSLAVYQGAARKENRYNCVVPEVVSAPGAVMQVDYQRGDTAKSVQIDLKSVQPTYRSWLRYLFPIMKKTFAHLDGDLLYLNLGKITSATLDSLMANHEQYKGIIMDLRIYPKHFNIYWDGKYFISDTTLFAICSYNNPQNLGHRKMTEIRCVRKPEKYYQGRIVLLVDHNTISKGEFTAMGLQQAPDVITVGSPTAGCDGDSSPIPLPFADSARFSTIGVYYPDGRQTQRIGVDIDVLVYPSPEGIRQGRDELLENAISILRAPRSE